MRVKEMQRESKRAKESQKEPKRAKESQRESESVKERQRELKRATESQRESKKVKERQRKSCPPQQWGSHFSSHFGLAGEMPGWHPEGIGIDPIRPSGVGAKCRFLHAKQVW